MPHNRPLCVKEEWPVAESDFPMLQGARPVRSRSKAPLASKKFPHFGTTFQAALAFAVLSLPLGLGCAV